MVVLTLAFAGVALSLPLMDQSRWPGDAIAQIARGIHRFAILVMTPALVGWWLLAGPLARRLGPASWLRVLIGIGAVWAIMLGVTVGGYGAG